MKTLDSSGERRPGKSVVLACIILGGLAAMRPVTMALPPESDTLDNAYARVLHNTVACGAAHTAGFGTRLIVGLSDVLVVSQGDSVSLGRGGVAVFPAERSYAVLSGDFFEVAIRNPHPRIKGPDEWVEPRGNIVVYEDAELRVFEERLGPGEDRALHSHAERIVVRLNEVQLTDPRFRPEGSPGKGIQVPNTVKFADPIVHVVRNLSTIPLFNIVIEFKVQPDTQ